MVKGTLAGHPFGAAGSRSSSLRLVDIPEDRRRRTVEHAGERGTPGARNEILAERNIDGLVVILFLDLVGEFLLFFGRGSTRKRVAHGLHFGIIRPAEPAAVLALAADRHIDNGIDDVGPYPIGEEHVPAALLRRLLAGASGHDGLPAGGLHVDLEAGSAQQ